MKINLKIEVIYLDNGFTEHFEAAGILELQY